MGKINDRYGLSSGTCQPTRGNFNTKGDGGIAASAKCLRGEPPRNQPGGSHYPPKCFRRAGRPLTPQKNRTRRARTGDEVSENCLTPALTPPSLKCYSRLAFDTERWQSGRLYLTRNQAYPKRVPWVRIPPSPPKNPVMRRDFLFLTT